MDLSHSPLYQERLQFTPRQRVVAQLTFTLVMIASLYGAYSAVDPILNGIPVTGHKMNEEGIASWYLVSMPILAIIPAVYIFKFLKYNFSSG